MSLFSRDQEFGAGAIHRIAYFSGNQPPVAMLTATPEWGQTSPGQLEADFDAGDSTDSDLEALAYEWDLDEDGEYDDGTGSQQTKTFSDSQNHTVAVRVRDLQGARSVARATVYPGDSPPEPEILEPQASLEWGVGAPIEFSGSAEDADESGSSLPDTRLDWSTRLYHCPGGPGACHAHPLKAFPSVASGTLIAPDHDYPSHIELRLTATDSRGLAATTAVLLDPVAVEMEIVSDPPGVNLSAGFVSQTAPFDFTAIDGSSVTLAAPETVDIGGDEYVWKGWSDGGARVHTIVAGTGSTEYTASYLRQLPPADQPPKTEGIPTGKPPLIEAPTVPAPQTRLAKHPPRRTSKRRARFVFSSDDPGAHLLCRLDGAAWRPCVSPRAYSRLALGRHSFQAVAVGADGQYDPSPVTFRWRVLR